MSEPFSHGPAGRITLIETPTATTLHFAGEIDITLRAMIKPLLQQAFDRKLPIVLDTWDVVFIDSVGIAALIQAHQGGTAAGLPVTLPRPAAAVTFSLRLYGSLQLFRDPSATSGGGSSPR